MSAITSIASIARLITAANAVCKVADVTLTSPHENAPVVICNVTQTQWTELDAALIEVRRVSLQTLAPRAVTPGTVPNLQRTSSHYYLDTRTIAAIHPLANKKSYRVVTSAGLQVDVHCDDEATMMDEMRLLANQVQMANGIA